MFGLIADCASSGSSSTSPMSPSASFMAQKRRKAIAFSETSTEWGLFVKAMRQLTQSVKVVISVSADRMRPSESPLCCAGCYGRFAGGGCPIILLAWLCAHR
jgi:hypothetical protein